MNAEQHAYEDRIRAMCQQVYSVQSTIEEMSRDSTQSPTARIALRSVAEKLSGIAANEGKPRK